MLTFIPELESVRERVDRFLYIVEEVFFDWWILQMVILDRINIPVDLVIWIDRIFSMCNDKSWTDR